MDVKVSVRYVNPGVKSPQVVQPCCCRFFSVMILDRRYVVIFVVKNFFS